MSFKRCARPGCMSRVKRRTNRYCSPACIPRELRVENCRLGRRTYAYRRRAVAFRLELDRLTVRRRLTREDLLEAFQAVYRRAYNSGWQCGERAGRLRDGSSLTAARAREAA